MAKQTLNTLRNWFKTGLKPTQQQFWDTWDSFWHKDQVIPASSIENLDARFDEKADRDLLFAHLKDPGAHDIESKLNLKVDKEAGKGLSSNDYTTAEKQKLAELFPGMSIHEYDPAVEYQLDDIVYLEDLEGNRLLYQSQVNQNVNGMASTNQPVYWGTGKPPQSIFYGITLPSMIINAVYNENLEAVINFIGVTQAKMNDEISAKQNLEAAINSVNVTEIVMNDGIRVKLKKDDGRVVGFFWDLQNFLDNMISLPVGTYKTITIKENADSLNNTEILIDITQVGKLVQHIYYRSAAGVDYKIWVGNNNDDQVVDLTTAVPSTWKYIGLPKPVPVDTSKFLNTAAGYQEKAGQLNIQNELFNRHHRALYSGEYPYNQGYGTMAYLNEYAFGIDTSVAQAGDYTILGDHYSISYFATGFELTVNDLDSTLNKTFRVKTSPGTSIGGQGLDNGLWNKILPVEDVQGDELSTHTGSEVDLEIQYAYPGRYRLRIRTRKPRSDNYTVMRLNCIIKCDNGTFEPNPVEYDGTNVHPIVKTGNDPDFNVPDYTITERNFGAVVAKGKQTVMSRKIYNEGRSFAVKQLQGFDVNIPNQADAGVELGAFQTEGLNGQRSFRVMVSDGIAGGSSSKEFIVHWNYDILDKWNNQGWFAILPAFGSGDRGGFYVLEHEANSGKLRLRIKGAYEIQEPNAPLTFAVMVETYLGLRFKPGFQQITDSSPYRYEQGFLTFGVPDNLPDSKYFPDHTRPMPL